MSSTTLYDTLLKITQTYIHFYLQYNTFLDLVEIPLYRNFLER